MIRGAFFYWSSCRSYADSDVSAEGNRSNSSEERERVEFWTTKGYFKVKDKR